MNFALNDDDDGEGGRVKDFRFNLILSQKTLFPRPFSCYSIFFLCCNDELLEIKKELNPSRKFQLFTL